MGGTVLGVHHVGRRLNIVTRLTLDRVIVFGIGRHRQTMMPGAVQRSVVSLICGELARMVDVVLRLILLAIVGGSSGQCAGGSEVVIFIWRAR